MYKYFIMKISYCDNNFHVQNELDVCALGIKEYCSLLILQLIVF